MWDTQVTYKNLRWEITVTIPFYQELKFGSTRFYHAPWMLKPPPNMCCWWNWCKYLGTSQIVEVSAEILASYQHHRYSPIKIVTNQKKIWDPLPIKHGWLENPIEMSIWNWFPRSIDDTKYPLDIVDRSHLFSSWNPHQIFIQSHEIILKSHEITIKSHDMSIFHPFFRHVFPQYPLGLPTVPLWHRRQVLKIGAAAAVAAPKGGEGPAVEDPGGQHTLWGFSLNNDGIMMGIMVYGI